MRTDAVTLERLSFARVQQALAERAATYMGAQRAAAVGPGLDPDQLRLNLDRVEELVEGGLLALGGIEDIRPLLKRVREGNLLDGREILAVAHTLDSASTLRRSVVSSGRPALAALAAGIGSFDGSLRLVREQLDNDGNVRDDATPKLHDIRRRLNPLRGRIRERLQRLLESHAEVVQDPIITLRRDRYVIPVKAYAQSQLPGLALDRSDSGATVFLEPAAVVEMNNELALLQLEEQDEVRRILYALGRRLADEPLVDATLEVVAELDVINSSARLARDWQLARPTFGDDGRVMLANARHPLIPGCVPNDIELTASQRLLIITGPNAGGKTVLLKTLGLAATMAHSGLFVAAGGAKVPLLPRLEALMSDIGDQQSIEANLSTYAGHLSNLKRIVEGSNERTLVLIDELGSGTDPDEGAALSQAILESVLRTGARGMVTTHLAPLKVFASRADGASNAAMRFDLDLLRPSYQLVVGEPGRSYALAIAERLGLDATLLERAAELLGPEAGRLEALLETLEQQREELETELSETRAANASALAEAALLRQQIDMLRSRESELMAAAAERADELLQETMQRATKLRRAATQAPEQRASALEELQRLRRETRQLAGRASAPSARSGDQAVQGGAAAGVGAPGPRAKGARAVPAGADPLAPGSLVRVTSYNADGQVLERRGERLMVQLGALKVEVPVRDVTPQAPKPAATAQPSAIGAANFERELNVRGERVEEALEKVRDFVIEAKAMRVGSVRIMHGKGTGALRDAVRNFLKNDRLVARYEDAVPYEGGHGVTVVYLKE